MSTVAAFLRRDANVALSYRVPFLLETISAFFVLLTFSLLARVVDPGRVADFFSFAAVGLGLTAFLQAGLSIVAANFRQEQVQGTLEAVLSTGIGPARLAAGMAAYPIAFALVRVVIFVALAAILGARAPGGNWGLAAGATALGALAFAGLGMVAAGMVIVFRQAAAAVGFLVTLLTLAGGALFPPHLLPGWAESLGRLSPFTHALRLARGALLGSASWGSSLDGLAILGALSVAFLAIGVGSLRVAIGVVRRRGGAGEY